MCLSVCLSFEALICLSVFLSLCIAMCVCVSVCSRLIFTGTSPAAHTPRPVPLCCRGIWTCLLTHRATKYAHTYMHTLIHINMYIHTYTHTHRYIRIACSFCCAVVVPALRFSNGFVCVSLVIFFCASLCCVSVCSLVRSSRAHRCPTSSYIPAGSALTAVAVSDSVVSNAVRTVCLSVFVYVCACVCVFVCVCVCGCGCVVLCR